MSAITDPGTMLSARRRAAGAAVPAACLAALLATWSIWRVADDVTQSVAAGQVITRLLIHVLVAIVPLVALLVIGLRPPQGLLRRMGFVPFAIGTALLAMVWVPAAIFLTFYLGN